MIIKKFIFLTLSLMIVLFAFLGIFLPPLPQPLLAQNLQNEVPIGILGYRLGAYLTIEGIRAEKGKVGTNTLLVDKVNGKKLDMPVSLWVDNLEYPGLPKGERCILRGYESGKMIGLPDEVAKKEHLPRPQFAWGFFRYFVVTSVVQPASLAEKFKLKQ
jgi:hypothetical protein